MTAVQRGLGVYQIAYHKEPILSIGTDRPGNATALALLFYAVLFAIAFGGLLFLSLLPFASVSPVGQENTPLEQWLNIILNAKLLYGATAVALLLLFFLILMGKRRRHLQLTNHMLGWLLISYVAFSHVCLAAWLFYKARDPSTLTLLTDLIAGDREQFHFASGYFGAALFAAPLWGPLFFSLFLWREMSKALTIDIIKAYDDTTRHDDDFRREYVALHHAELLANEDDIIRVFRKGTSRLRFFILDLIWWGPSTSPNLDRDRLFAYYNEPRLLLALAKTHYSIIAPLTGGRMMTSFRKNSSVTVPNDFDVVRIEQDLLKYRFDQGALSDYFSGLILRFRTKNYRKKLHELMQLYDIAIEFKGQLYKYKRESGRAASIAELENILDEEKLTTSIEEERAKRQRLLQPIESAPTVQVTPEDSQEQELRQVERELRHKYRLKQIEDDIKSSYQEEKAQRKLRELDRLLQAQAERIQHIERDGTLRATEKDEARRASEQAFIKQLDEFERSL